MNDVAFNLQQVSWQDLESHLRNIRSRVFIEEQHVPAEMEWDGYDETCVHIIVEMNGEYVATGRLLETGQIGRMAVLQACRRKGIASKILEMILSIAESKQMETVFLNSQLEVVGFYKKYGFQEIGAVFDDAGIPHRKMKKALTKGV